MSASDISYYNADSRPLKLSFVATILWIVAGAAFLALDTAIVMLLT